MRVQAAFCCLLVFLALFRRLSRERAPDEWNLETSGGTRTRVDGSSSSLSFLWDAGRCQCHISATGPRLTQCLRDAGLTPVTG